MLAHCCVDKTITAATFLFNAGKESARSSLGLLVAGNSGVGRCTSTV